MSLAFPQQTLAMRQREEVVQEVASSLTIYKLHLLSLHLLLLLHPNPLSLQSLSFFIIIFFLINCGVNDLVLRFDC